ncbi:MAG: hypothetical protein ACOYL9_16030, partial [Ilumatobacteraceae bacterium]
ASTDPIGRYVYAGASVSIEGSDPFDARGPYDPNRLLGIGWPTFSPLYEARRERLGLGGNLLVELARQQHLYVVMGFDPQLVVDAYQRRLGWDVLLVEVGALENGARVYRVDVIAPDDFGPR